VSFFEAFLREARKSNSAVATEKNLRKEKWQKITRGLDTADLTPKPLEKFALKKEAQSK